MKINDVEIFGWRKAIEGIRNAKKSWDRSDSVFGVVSYYPDIISEIINCNVSTTLENEGVDEEDEKYYNEVYDKFTEWYWDNGVSYPDEDTYEYHIIGPADMKLIKSLIKGGSEHRKFLRMIHVQADITAPLYIWKEFDTYKIGTTSNSESTMHTIQNEIIDIENFETDDIQDFEAFGFERAVDLCESLRQMYISTGDKKYWKALIRFLPESWLQMRTIDLNYENLLNIYFQRKNHKLSEWNYICSWIKSLPYMDEFIRVCEEK